MTDQEQPLVLARPDGDPAKAQPDCGPALAPPERDPAARLADHRMIDRLAEEVVPAIIAKLSASGLGEIEVREGSWRVRLRRPPAPDSQRRAADHGDRSGRPAAAGSRGAGSGPGSGLDPAGPRSALMAVGPGRSGGPGGAHGEPGEADLVEPSTAPLPPQPLIATSPAVGFYQPRHGLAPGTRVRVGDPLGSVDILGIQQEVPAPADGLVGATLVEPGQAVEYGQALVELMPATPAAAHGSVTGSHAQADRG